MHGELVYFYENIYENITKCDNKIKIKLNKNKIK